MMQEEKEQLVQMELMEMFGIPLELCNVEPTENGFQFNIRFISEDEAASDFVSDDVKRSKINDS